MADAASNGLSSDADVMSEAVLSFVLGVIFFVLASAFSRCSVAAAHGMLSPGGLIPGSHGYW